jgi:hypothetical protein
MTKRNPAEEEMKNDRDRKKLQQRYSVLNCECFGFPLLLRESHTLTSLSPSGEDIKEAAETFMSRLAVKTLPRAVFVRLRRR